jgi:hypothetical protein
LVAWLAVGVFWLIATRSFHPTWTLAIVTTGALVASYAAASYVNQLVLVPSYWHTGRYGSYAASLVAIMAFLTAVALAVIRTCYIMALGPDPDPNGLYVHYGIDFAGMVVHLLAAVGVVAMVTKFSRSVTGAGEPGVAADRPHK